MKKKILFSIVAVFISLFCCDKVLAEETCDLVEAKQYKVYGTYKNYATMPFFVFEYKDDGSPDLKESFFYNQELLVGEQNERAYCIDRGKWNGEGPIYTPSVEAYQEIINGYSNEKYGDPIQQGSGMEAKHYTARQWADRLAKGILGFRDYLDFLYDENTTEILSTEIKMFDQETIEKMSSIVLQTMAWIWSNGNGHHLAIHILRPHVKILVAQAYCGIVLKNNAKDPMACTFIPKTKVYASQEPKYYTADNMTPELWEAYQATDNPRYRVGDCKNEACAVATLFLNHFDSAASKYEESGKQPAIYLPSDTNRQRLLSSYHCSEIPEPIDGCWELKVKIPTVCKTEASARSGLVSDPESGEPGWGCIFKASEDAEIYSGLKDHYSADETNPYCEVFCREEIKMEFAEPGTSVFQGRYLTVGLDNERAENILPINYQGKKECRVTSDYAGQSDQYIYYDGLYKTNIGSSTGGAISEGTIAYRKFEVDYLRLTARANSAWDTYQLEQARLDACGKRESFEIDGVCKNCVTERKCEIEYETTIVPGGNEVKKPVQKCENVTTCEEPHDCETWGHNSAEGVYGVFKTTFGGYTRTTCGHPSSPNTPDPCFGQSSRVSAAKRVWENLVAERQRLLDSIQSCVSSTKTAITYNTFKPKVKIEYEEKTYGDEFELEANLKTKPGYPNTTLYNVGTSEDLSVSSYSTGGFSRNAGLINSDFSEGQYYVYTDLTYNIAEWWQSTIIKEANYTLPDDIYRFVEKGTGQSVHKSSSLVRTHYIDIGTPNLPIHYSTAPNEGTGDLYEFRIITESFGPANKFDKYVFRKNAFANKYYYSKYGDYVCGYTVKCNPLISGNPLCSSTPNTGDGLNLVYRTISLYSKKDAFPGINGKGRTPGANWNNNELIRKYITDNRNVKNYAIYTDLDPLYEIELTPGLMRKVRKYNKDVNSRIETIYDKTGARKKALMGYSNFEDFVCEKNTGKKCKSSLLRGTLSGYSEVKVTGCAMADSKASYKRCSTVDQAW